jgi:hypothetical protein
VLREFLAGRRDEAPARVVFVQRLILDEHLPSLRDTRSKICLKLNFA